MPIILCLNRMPSDRGVFTWEGVSYNVPVSYGRRQLISDVYGYVKPGTLTALMGASGAGKTTCLDVLAKRKNIGVVSGEILVNGHPTGPDFARSTAYAEQMDVHEGTATVREAMRFSAYLRQPFDVPKEDKNMDAQSARNLIRVLRRLADQGQAILCTVHQPSSVLFESFDRLLLLENSGHSVYFGDIGPDSCVVRDYFARCGAVCPQGANIAEYMLDAIGAGIAPRIGHRDWKDIWLDSPEFQLVKEEIRELKQFAASGQSGMASKCECLHGFRTNGSNAEQTRRRFSTNCPWSRSGHSLLCAVPLITFSRDSFYTLAPRCSYPLYSFNLEGA